MIHLISLILSISTVFMLVQHKDLVFKKQKLFVFQLNWHVIRYHTQNSAWGCIQPATAETLKLTYGSLVAHKEFLHAAQFHVTFFTSS